MERLFQGDFHVVTQIRAAPVLLARATASAATAKGAAEDRLENVADIAKVALAKAAARPATATIHALSKGVVAVAIIGRALLRVFEHLIRFGAGLELGLSLCVARIAIRVIFHRKLAIGAFERLLVNIARDAQRFVIRLGCGHVSARLPFLLSSPRKRGPRAA